MQFVKTNIGLINLAFVERIQRSHVGKAILEFKETSATSELSFEDLEDSIGTIIPNTTEAQALFMEAVDGKVEHWLAPIIAWKMNRYDPEPLLMSGDKCSFVLLPSGQVDELFVGSFDSIEDAKADFLKRQAF